MTKGSQRLAVAAVVLAATGCVIEAEPEVEDVAVAEAAALVSSVIEYNSDVHAPGNSCGDTMILNDQAGNVLNEWPINCSIMGLTNTAGPDFFEVVASPGLVSFSGGPSAPVTCGMCEAYNPPIFGRVPPAGAHGLPPGVMMIGFLSTMSTTTVVLGSVYAGAYNWYVDSSVGPGMFSSLYTSYCAAGRTKWGRLTDNYGRERTPGALGRRYYQMYSYPFMRAANTTSSGILVLPRGDACNP